MEPSKTFEATKEDTLKEALKYYVGITAIFSALYAVLFAFTSTQFEYTWGRFGIGFGMTLGAGTGIAGAISIFVKLLIGIVISVFIFGTIVHIFVYIMGGRKGFDKTIMALMYAGTPYLLFGWIPYVGLIAMIWLLVLNVLGIRQFQELTTGRAILVFLIPIIIIFILLGAGSTTTHVGSPIPAVRVDNFT